MEEFSGVISYTPVCLVTFLSGVISVVFTTSKRQFSYSFN